MPLPAVASSIKVPDQFCCEPINGMEILEPAGVLYFNIGKLPVFIASSSTTVTVTSTLLSFCIGAIGDTWIAAAGPTVSMIKASPEGAPVNWLFKVSIALELKLKVPGVQSG